MTFDLSKHPERSLLRVKPELVPQWDWEMNYPFTPADVAANSPKVVGWCCKNGHRWPAALLSRQLATCHFCRGGSGSRKYIGENDWPTLQPVLLLEWDFDKNLGVDPSEASLTKKYWWKCLANGHSFDALLQNRLRGSGCRYCSGFAAVPGETDFVTLNPSLGLEFDSVKNGSLKPETLKPHSAKLVWWRCKLNHSFRDSVAHRTEGRKCCYCSNRKLLSGFNDLETRYPLIAADWDEEKNVGIIPSKIFPGTVKRYWWRCHFGHDSYKMSPNKRVNRNQGCPQCAKKLASKIECELYEGLSSVLAFPKQGERLASPLLLTQAAAVDISGVFNGRSVVIEYDGDYWHQGKEKTDKLKTLGLLEQAYLVIRIRAGALELLPLSHPALYQISCSRSESAEKIADSVKKLLMEVVCEPIYKS